MENEAKEKLENYLQGKQNLAKMKSNHGINVSHMAPLSIVKAESTAIAWRQV